jgi:hypothetical protein
MFKIKNLSAIVFLIVLFAAPAFSQDTFEDCGMQGDTSSSVYIQTMSRLKNRYKNPKAKDFDSAVSFISFLSKGNDVGRFKENKAVEIIAWVRDVKWGSKESCNCSHTGQNLQDVHIELVKTKNTTSQKKVVVAEITPRLREALLGSLGININNAGNTLLKKTLKKHKVKIKGWLFFDWEHFSNAENTDPHDDDNIRATVWEIHPITYLEIIQ